MGATTWTRGWGEGAWGYNGFGGIAPAYVVDGVAGTGAVGTIALRIDSNVTPTGVQGVGEIGGFVVQVDDIVIPVGVAGVGAVGQVRIRGWTEVNDAQNANWIEVNDAQTPNWVEVDVAA